MARHSLQIESNVAFDTIGHSYFLEDGIETKNVLVDNLGLLTRAASPGANILPSDLTPATFWITNPDNTLRGNVAAGSEYYGFWYSFPKHPTGASESVDNSRRIWPRRTPLGECSGNVAHSNEHTGLFVDNGPNLPGETETPTYDPKQFPIARKGPKDSPPAPAYFDDFTGYKNRRRGMWLRGSYLRVRRARLADNSIGITLAASSTKLENARIVGETANTGHAAPGETTGAGGRTLPKPGEPRTPLCGFEFYDGLVSVHDVTFVNFRSDRQRKAGSLGYLRFSPFFIDPHNFIERAVFENATAVYLQTKGRTGESGPERGRVPLRDLHRPGRIR
jgi:cell migration-inducing and hyaluronan-binding protein